MHPIDSLFDWFLSATARGSLLAIAVLLVQAAFGRRLPAVWRHALWLPVLFVLGSPVLPRSSFSLENRWSHAGAEPVRVMAEPVAAASPAPSGATLAAPSGRTIDVVHLAGWVWIVGVVAFLLVGAIAWLRTLSSFRRGAVPLEPELDAEIREAAESRGLSRRPEVLVSIDIPGPAMSGVYRPLLLLPASFSTAFDREERRLILLHELTHVKRGDLLLNAIVFVLQALHWCNPLVWFAFARFRADRELACDSAVLSAADEDRRGLYGNALLKVEAAATVPRRLGFVGLVGLFGRGWNLKSRLSAIAAHRGSHPASTFAGLLLFLCLAFAGATRAQNETTQPGKQIVIETKFIEVPVDAKIEIHSGRSTFDPKSATMVFSSDNDVADVLASTPGADILSAPSVVTSSGQKATIEIGQEVLDAEGKPRHVGACLEILPTRKDGVIHLSLHARNTRVVTATGGGTPAFAEREIKTEISVKSGDTLIVDSMDQNEKPAPAKRLLLTVRTRVLEDESVVRARLEKIIIPEIELRDAPLSNALASLREKARDFDPEKKGVNVIHIPAEGAAEPLITVSFKEIPLTEALKYLAALADLEVDFGDPAVVLRPRAGVPVPVAGSVTAPAPVVVKGSRTADLAARTVLGRVEFQEVSLREAIQFLQLKSVELDPERKGLNMILKAPGAPSPDEIRLSLSLAEVRLSEALRYVAELSNLRIRYDEEAVVIFRD